MVMVVATTTMLRHHKTMPQPPNTLGILAFEAAKTMCRLISLYNSLSDKETTNLRCHVIKSKGVSYLNSQQESFLLNLAAAEHLECLDTVAATVLRLARRCSDIGLTRFDLVYNDLKLGIIDFRKLNYGTRSAHKLISKMEKLVSATGSLYSAMETMAAMEASEKKTQRWKTMGIPKANMEYFNENNIALQRKQVQHYKEVSLWNQTFNKTIGIMARVVCIVYARICSVFIAYVSGSYSNNIGYGFDHYCLIEHRELYKRNRCISDQYEESLQKRATMSGPIPKTTKTGIISFSNTPNIDVSSNSEVGHCTEKNGNININHNNNKVYKLAPASTVGGAGLSARYARVIMLAEQCLHAPAVGEEAREELYEMLPERVREKLRAKLRGRRLKGEEDGAELAEGWREAVEELMEWLVPVARDTVRWQEERHMEQKRLEMKSTVLLLQTLHYSDLEKAEAAIVEVLVGLSCIYWYERRRR